MVSVDKLITNKSKILFIKGKNKTLVNKLSVIKSININKRLNARFNWFKIRNGNFKLKSEARGIDVSCETVACVGATSLTTRHKCEIFCEIVTYCIQTRL